MNKPPEDFLAVLNARSQDIFKKLVERYLETGIPVGSRDLSRLLESGLSPASVRNVMADLEDLGLIAAPHTSAGRAPTQRGLRFFVDAMLEVGAVDYRERDRIAHHIEDQSHQRPRGSADRGEPASVGPSHGAGLVIAAKSDMVLRHIEFVRLDAEFGDGDPRRAGRPGREPRRPAAARSHRQRPDPGLQLHGEPRRRPHHFRGADGIAGQRAEQRAELDEITRRLVEQGLATLSTGSNAANPTVIVRGRANLINDAMASDDLARVRKLFDELESKNGLMELLGDAEKAQGVRIFIGSENKLFSLSGSSVILSPYKDANDKVVGVLGVIGPTRLNYARIVPVVDYTAHVISQLMARKG